MGVLDELNFYCRNEKPVGALAFLGESGSGKTYLIENDLREMMKDSHMIVRVSLYGINSIDALHLTVKKAWLEELMPLRMNKDPGTLEKIQNSLFKTAKAVLKIINPKAASLADAAADPMEYIVVKPVVEDLRTKTKKRVVLVFDDIDHTKLDHTMLSGCINDYCENQHFNTIVIADNDYLTEGPNADSVIREAKKKAVAYILYNNPDYKKILHNIISDRSWRTGDYAGFLEEHEGAILDLFGQGVPDTVKYHAPLAKHNNIRSLSTALESFYRVYYHLKKDGIQDPEPYLCSFIPFYLANKDGIMRDGKTCFDPTDEELRELYPRFSPEYLPACVRQWIRLGYWDSELWEAGS